MPSYILMVTIILGAPFGTKISHCLSEIPMLNCAFCISSGRRKTSRCCMQGEGHVSSFSQIQSQILRCPRTAGLYLIYTSIFEQTGANCRLYKHYVFTSFFFDGLNYSFKGQNYNFKISYIYVNIYIWDHDICIENGLLAGRGKGR